MSVRSDVLLWAQRIVAKRNALPHQLLEVAPDAGADEAQVAFHKIARFAHPDLHCNSLTSDELDLVTKAYARIAAAYQDVRKGKQSTGPFRSDPPPPRTMSYRPPTDPSEATGASGGAPRSVASAVGAAGAAGAAGAMSSKALIYYRKAELCLRRGDLRGAVLQLKLAIASDPQSGFLRSALAEVEAEVK